jgi:hypothetical protein
VAARAHQAEHAGQLQLERSDRCLELVRRDGQELVARADGVAQLVLGALAIGDVLHHGHGVARPAASVAHHREGAVHPHRRTDGREVTHLDHEVALAGRDPLEQGGHRRHVVRVGQVVRAQPDDLLARTAHDLAEALVDRQQAAVERRLHDADRDLAQDRAQALLALLHLGQRLAPLAPDVGLAQLALHGRHQPGQVVLEDVVVGAGLHRGHRQLLADAPRHDDERQVDAQLLHEVQRGGRPEPRQGEVGDDQVPLLTSHRGSHGRRRLHSLERDVEPGLVQETDNEDRIIIHVFDDEHAQRFHGLARVVSCPPAHSAARSPRVGRARPRFKSLAARPSAPGVHPVQGPPMGSPRTLPRAIWASQIGR